MIDVDEGSVLLALYTKSAGSSAFIFSVKQAKCWNDGNMKMKTPCSFETSVTLPFETSHPRRPVS